MLKRLLPILLILCLLLGACHSTPTTEASTETATEAATEERVASQESSSEESAPLSELFLEDYDQLWQILEEDYPYLDYLKTQIPDLNNIRAEYREKAAEAEDAPDLCRVLNALFAQLDYFAHLQLVSPYGYSIYCKYYLDSSQGVPASIRIPFRQALTAPHVEEFYRSIMGEEPEQPDYTASRPFPDVRYYEDCKTLYIHIHTFTDEVVTRDKALLSENLEKYPETEHIIFDIRGNGGGSDAYWRQNMVAPFEEPVQWSFRSYYRNTSLVGPYYAGYGQPLSSLQDVPDWVREYGLDRYFTGGFSYYKGALGSRVVSLPAAAAGCRRWVLTDRAVYSSSDSFACFCKDTGWATLVGQTTGGDGLTSMPVLAPLKNTGILFRFSGAAGEGPGGIPNAIQGVEPDHPCESDGDALEYCLELIRQETP